MTSPRNNGCSRLSTEDPHDIYDRFIQTQQMEFDTAIKEINDGEKQSCWLWFMLPTAPYIVDGEERGSPLNRLYALRGNEAVIAYLTFETVNGVNLRENYIELVSAIREQMLKGNTLRLMFGSVDDVKTISSFRLFERVGKELGDKAVYKLCEEVLDLAAKERKMLENQ